MTLYDEVIKQWDSLLRETNEKGCATQFYDYNPDKACSDAGRNNLVFGSEMAYELGGQDSKKSAIGATVITSNPDFVNQSCTLLLGQELKDIKEDLPYARLTVCLVDKEDLGQGEQLFNMVKAIDYVRYHVNPEGFMMRISATQKRESVRVSHKAITDGISFEKVGNLINQSFLKNKRIIKVKTIFINTALFDYQALEATVKKSDLITKAIDHASQTALMDCHSCSLQEVCEEVEGIKELHFGNKQTN